MEGQARAFLPGKDRPAQCQPRRQRCHAQRRQPERCGEQNEQKVEDSFHKFGLR